MRDRRGMRGGMRRGNLYMRSAGVVLCMRLIVVLGWTVCERRAGYI